MRQMHLRVRTDSNNRINYPTAIDSTTGNTTAVSLKVTSLVRMVPGADIYI